MLFLFSSKNLFSVAQLHFSEREIEEGATAQICSKRREIFGEREREKKNKIVFVGTTSC